MDANRHVVQALQQLAEEGVPEPLIRLTLPNTTVKKTLVRRNANAI